MENRSFGRLTCVAGEDLVIGDAVKFDVPVAVTAHPIAIKTTADDTVLGVAMTNAAVATGDTVDVRLFIAGTISVKTDIQAAESFDPGNPSWVGVGEMNEAPVGDLQQMVGIMVERDIVSDDDDGARLEHLILTAEPAIDVV